MGLLSLKFRPLETTAIRGVNAIILNMHVAGAQWIAVPGELRGYEEAHKRYGRLPWKTLFKPTIKLLESGFKIPRILSLFLSNKYLQGFLKNSSLG